LLVANRLLPYSIAGAQFYGVRTVDEIRACLMDVDVLRAEVARAVGNIPGHESQALQAQHWSPF
jgi:hypothetical protein